MDVVFGGLAFYFSGYGIAYGNLSIPFMGLGDFLPDGEATYLFQFSFAATSTTIVSGCIAVRMKLFAYYFFAFDAVIAYAFVAHWVWWSDDGWLGSLAFHDGLRITRDAGRHARGVLWPHDPSL